MGCARVESLTTLVPRYLPCFIETSGPAGAKGMVESKSDEGILKFESNEGILKSESDEAVTCFVGYW